MLSMNMSAAPQINPSAENPVAITTNSKSKPIVGEKQKTGTEKFAQVLEREITEAGAGSIEPPIDRTADRSLLPRHRREWPPGVQ